MGDYSLSTLVDYIRTISLKAVAETMPSGIYFGTVISINPLKINVEQRLNLEQDHLILTSNVVDYETYISLDNSEINITRNKAIIHNSLEVDEKVILLRKQGGQRYIVLDRVVI